MGAQNYNNPYNRGLSHAFEFHFPATVTHGVFHGERAPEGSKPFMNSTGLSSLTAHLVIGERYYPKTRVQPGTRSTGYPLFVHGESSF
jgi:hypothetical protein